MVDDTPLSQVCHRFGARRGTAPPPNPLPFNLQRLPHLTSKPAAAGSIPMPIPGNCNQNANKTINAYLP
jgi:hypothetical protein